MCVLEDNKSVCRDPIERCNEVHGALGSMNEAGGMVVVWQLRIVGASREESERERESRILEMLEGCSTWDPLIVG